jgi:hypothetical protein
MTWNDEPNACTITKSFPNETEIKGDEKEGEVRNRAQAVDCWLHAQPQDRALLAPKMIDHHMAVIANQVF